MATKKSTGNKGAAPAARAKAKRYQASPSYEQQHALLRAFTCLNDDLFDGKLNRPMLYLTRSSKVIGGYFGKDKWVNDSGQVVHEIAINANMMGNRDIVQLMNILIHEMIHMWQYDYGKPTRSGYHNAEFADKAESMGLEPKDLQTGKRTGQAVQTHPVQSGAAAFAIANLPDEAILPWMAFEGNPDPGQGSGSGGQGGSGGSESGQDGQEGEGQGSGQGSGSDGAQDGSNQSGEGSSGGSSGGSQDSPSSSSDDDKSRSGVRAKYTCPVCGLNAWAKRSVKLVCWDDNMLMVEQV